MQLQALSIGDSVPHETFDAVIQTAFHSAVNLRLADEGHLVTLLISEDHELPQGIRIWTKALSLQSLTPGGHAAARGGILRFDSSPITVDLRGAPVWKCHIAELALDTKKPAVQQAWLTAWNVLNQEQKNKNSDLHANELFHPNPGSPLVQRIRQPVLSLVASTNDIDPRSALDAAEQMIGLGPGITPSGDDILVGFLAGLWSMAGRNKRRHTFIHAFGRDLIQLATGTSEISRTYLCHAAHGQFSSSICHLLEAMAAGRDVLKSVAAALSMGHSSGMDAVTGLLIGLCAWSQGVPYNPILRPYGQKPH